MKTKSPQLTGGIEAQASSRRWISLKPSFQKLVGLALLGAGLAAANAATASDFLFGTLPKAGAESYDLPYRLLVPAAYFNSAESFPLIVFLHGAGEKGTNNTAQLGNNANGALQLVSAANQTAYPCFMLAPQAHPYEGWNATTLGQVIRAISTLSQTYAIDPNRIYVTGLSMGGNGTWNIVGLHPFTFAAAVPMSGWGSGNYDRMCGLPIWAFHAANDTTVNVSGTDGAVSAVRSAGGRVIYTRYATGGHTIWGTAYNHPELLPWMMAQRRNQAVAGVPIVAITTPATHLLPPPGPVSLAVSGLASMTGGVSKINWTTTPWIGGAGNDTSTYALASGLETWSIASVPNADNFLVIATGASGSASFGGVTTVNDFLWKPNRSANTTPPTIAVSSPTTGAPYSTTVNSLSLSGTAATTAPYKTIRQITWINNRGGQGFAAGTTSWSVQGIDLQPGENIINLTVRDSNNYSATTSFVANFGVVPANTPPVISTLASLTVAHGAILAPITFTIGDAETSSTNLIVTATSSNLTLLPASGVILAGSDSNRTLTLLPAAGQSGSGTITVSVSDGLATTSASFVLTVAANNAPVISALADVSVVRGSAVAPISFTLADVETDPASLVISVGSSNPMLLPAASVEITGVGASRTLTLLPAPGQTGAATVSILVSDGQATTTGSFVFTVIDPTPPVVVEVDFGAGNTQSAGSVNNLTSVTNGLVANAVSMTGSSTPIGIAVTDAFSGINSAGVNQAGAFVATAQVDSFYIDASGNTVGVVTISNLSAAKIYDLSLFASRAANDNRTTLFTVNGVSQSINAANNANQLVNFSGLSPVNGQIVIEVRAGAGSGYGYLNALRLKEITP